MYLGKVERCPGGFINGSVNIPVLADHSEQVGLDLDINQNNSTDQQKDYLALALVTIYVKGRYSQGQIIGYSSSFLIGGKRKRKSVITHK